MDDEGSIGPWPSRKRLLAEREVPRPDDGAGHLGRLHEEAHQRWVDECLEPMMARNPELQPPEGFISASSASVQRLATPWDMRDAGFDHSDHLGYPGLYPFTRGVQPSMYRARLWTMRQYAGYATAVESNARYRYLLEQGQTGLSVAFDLPTQIGFDSDHVMAAGEVGKVGVAIDTLGDMETLFDQVPLDRVSTSMTINAPAAVMLALYMAVAEKQGVSSGTLRGTVQNDILKEYIARGTYIYPPGPSLKLATDIIEYCAEEAPRWNTISISGYHMREAGCTAVQELAFTLANGVTYVEAAQARGLEVDSFAPRLAFFFCCHNDLLEEVAKFRAARFMWAQIMRERFGAEDPRSWTLRFHTQTAGCTLTAQQPENNVVRVAIQALAAVLGGTQSLHTNSMDEALALPTEKAVRIALRTQQVVALESGVANTIDPLAGSYFVEHRTRELVEEAQGLMERVQRRGGMLRAIESGWVQREIADSAYRYQKEIEGEQRFIVGVNCHNPTTPTGKTQSGATELLRVDPAIEAAQNARVERWRRERGRSGVENALTRLKEAAEGYHADGLAQAPNLMPLILKAVKNGVTLGEVSQGLREVWGEFRPVELL